MPDQFKDVYSHATEVALGEKLLFISGQFGVKTDGEIPTTFSGEYQVEIEAIAVR